MHNQNFETINWRIDEERGVGHLTLDRPASLNALSSQLREEFVQAFEAFERLDEEGTTIRAVVLEGAGDKAFCVGADLQEFEQGGPRTKMFESKNLHSVIERFRAPVIAKVDGYCLGGGLGLAIESDFRFASERSTFALPEVELGISPGYRLLRPLVQLVGPSRAKELGMTGEKIPAEEAKADGLVDYVYSSEEIDEAVTEFVDDLVDKPTGPVGAVKDIVNLHKGNSAGELYSLRAERCFRNPADDK